MWAQWGPCPPHCHGSGHGKARGPLLGTGQGPALSPPSLPLTHVESPRSPGGGQGHLGFACGARTRDRGDTCVQGRGQQTGSVASPVPSHKLRLCFHGKWCGRPQGSRTNSPCLADGAGSGPDSAQLCPRGWQGRGPAGPGAPCQLPGSPGWASRGSLLRGKEGSPGTSVTPPPGSHAAFTSPVTTRGTALPSWQPPSAGSSRRQSSTFGAHELRGPWPGTAWREGGTEADPRGEGAAPHRRRGGSRTAVARPPPPPQGPTPCPVHPHGPCRREAGQASASLALCTRCP